MTGIVIGFLGASFGMLAGNNGEFGHECYLTAKSAKDAKVITVNTPASRALQFGDQPFR